MFTLLKMFTNHTNYNENNVKSRSEVHISLQTLLTDEKWYTSNFFFSFEIQFNKCDCPFTQGMYDILTVSN